MGRKKEMTASLGRMLIKDTKRKQINTETNAIKSNSIDDNDANECSKSMDETIVQQLPDVQQSSHITTNTTIINNSLNSDTNIVFDNKQIESKEHIIESKQELNECSEQSNSNEIKEDLVCDEFDDAFFNPKLSNSHVKRIHGIKTDNSEQPVGRPPKKHFNRNKREKLRRVYSYLDK